MTRTGTTAAATLALALLAAGCSGGSGDKDSAPSKDKANAAAKAINLTKADAPSGWKTSDADNSGSGADDDKIALYGCNGLSKADAEDVVDVSSDDLVKGTEPLTTQVNSEVEVLSSLDQAERVRKAFSGDKAVDCVKKYFLDQIGKEADSSGAKIGTPKVTSRTPAGVDKGFGFDVTLPISASGISLNVKASVVGFFVKHTEVELTTLTIGEVPSDYDQGALLSKLQDRAKKSAV